MAQTGDVQYRRRGRRLPAAACRHGRLQICPTCRPNFPTCRSSAVCWEWRDRRIPTPPIPSSSSCSTRRSFLNGQYTVVGRVSKAWTMSTRSSAATTPTNGAVTDPDRMIKVTVRIFYWVAVVIPKIASQQAFEGDRPWPRSRIRKTRIIMDTTKGKVVIELLPDLARGSTSSGIKELDARRPMTASCSTASSKDFMAQTGDVQFGKTGGKDFNPARAGMGGSDKPDLKAEFSNQSHVRGTCSMARSQMPELRQFAVLHLLRGRALAEQAVFSVWGQVIEGMENVDQLKRGEPVRDPDQIVSMKVAADASGLIETDRFRPRPPRRARFCLCAFQGSDMAAFLWALLGIAAGACIAIQAPINAHARTWSRHAGRGRVRVIPVGCRSSLPSCRSADIVL
jgi:peptidyl-prolyl cis-trans isomerase B (cyclophilin B)